MSNFSLTGLALIAILFASLLRLPTSSFAQGKPSDDAERLGNGKPDYHQYEAQIERIIDADTLRVTMHILPGLEYKTNVRSRGINAPEIRGAKCDWEKTIAEEATEAIAKRFPIGSWVYIENIDQGSFAGRIIADIKQRYGNQRWRTVTKALLEKEGRWGAPYRRGEDFDWCQTRPSG